MFVGGCSGGNENVGQSIDVGKSSGDSAVISPSQGQQTGVPEVLTEDMKQDLMLLNHVEPTDVFPITVGGIRFRLSEIRFVNIKTVRFDPDPVDSEEGVDGVKIFKGFFGEFQLIDPSKPGKIILGEYSFYAVPGSVRITLIGKDGKPVGTINGQQLDQKEIADLIAKIEEAIKEGKSAEDIAQELNQEIKKQFVDTELPLSFLNLVNVTRNTLPDGTIEVKITLTQAGDMVLQLACSVMGDQYVAVGDIINLSLSKLAEVVIQLQPTGESSGSDGETSQLTCQASDLSNGGNTITIPLPPAPDDASWGGWFTMANNPQSLPSSGHSFPSQSPTHQAIAMPSPPPPLPADSLTLTTPPPSPTSSPVPTPLPSPSSPPRTHDTTTQSPSPTSSPVPTSVGSASTTTATPSNETTVTIGSGPTPPNNYLLTLGDYSAGLYRGILKFVLENTIDSISLKIVGISTGLEVYRLKKYVIGERFFLVGGAQLSLNVRSALLPENGNLIFEVTPPSSPPYTITVKVQ